MATATCAQGHCHLCSRPLPPVLGATATCAPGSGALFPARPQQPHDRECGVRPRHCCSIFPQTPQSCRTQRCCPQRWGITGGSGVESGFLGFLLKKRDLMLHRRHGIPVIQQTGVLVWVCSHSLSLKVHLCREPSAKQKQQFLTP